MLAVKQNRLNCVDVTAEAVTEMFRDVAASLSDLY